MYNARVTMNLACSVKGLHVEKLLQFGEIRSSFSPGRTEYKEISLAVNTCTRNTTPDFPLSIKLNE